MAGRYDPLKETHRRVAAEFDARSKDPVAPQTVALPSPSDREEAAIEHDARTLGKSVSRGKLDPDEALYRLRGLANKRLVTEKAAVQLDSAANREKALQFARATTGRHDLDDTFFKGAPAMESNTPSPNYDELARENMRKLVQQANLMQSNQARILGQGFDPKQQALDRSHFLDNPDRVPDARVPDAGQRFREQLEKFYTSTDPYGSLGQAARREYSDFLERNNELKHAADEERDPTRKSALEKANRLLAIDYIALTADRVSENAAQIAGSERHHEAAAYRKRADHFKQKASEERGEREFDDAKRAQDRRVADEPALRRERPEVNERETGGRRSADKGHDHGSFRQAGQEVTDREPPTPPAPTERSREVVHEGPGPRPAGPSRGGRSR